MRERRHPIFCQILSKARASEYRGSSDIRAAVDNGWLLSRDDGSNAGDALGRLVLKPYKTRTGPEKPIRIEYKDDVFVPLDLPPRPAADILRDMIASHRGANQKELIGLGAKQGLSQHRLVEALDECVRNGSIEAARQRHNKFRYYLPASRPGTSA